jgi:hypothetical protein
MLFVNSIRTLNCASVRILSDQTFIVGPKEGEMFGKKRDTRSSRRLRPLISV